MTTEQLKKLAEFAGISYTEVMGGAIGYDDNGVPTIYDPPHNDAQAFELLRKVLEMPESWEIYAMIYDEVIEGGQTLNAAICAAVIEIVNNE